MKYTKLGRSDLTVSRVCMGCMGFGDAGQGQHAWTLDEAHSREIIRHVDGAVKATELELTEEEIAYLEAPYTPHPLAGVMAQNKPAKAKEKHVWSTGNQKI